MSARTSPFETTVASFGTKPKAHRRPSAEEIDRTATFPSREPSQDSQGKVTLGINCSPELQERFRGLCKRERYSYAAMLTILLDNYDGR